MTDGLALWDMVEVEWYDTNSPDRNSWMTVGEMADLSAMMLIRSVGYFVGERDNYVQIVGSRSVSDEYETIVNRIESIPLGCVKSIRPMVILCH